MDCRQQLLAFVVIIVVSHSGESQWCNETSDVTFIYKMQHTSAYPVERQKVDRILLSMRLDSKTETFDGSKPVQTFTPAMSSIFKNDSSIHTFDRLQLKA